MNRNELQEYIVPYNTQHQGAVKVFNRTVQIFMDLSKRPQKGKYNLKNLIMTFWYTRTILITRLRRWFLSEQ